MSCRIDASVMFEFHLHEQSASLFLSGSKISDAKDIRCKRYHSCSSLEYSVTGSQRLSQTVDVNHGRRRSRTVVLRCLNSAACGSKERILLT